MLERRVLVEVLLYLYFSYLIDMLRNIVNIVLISSSDTECLYAHITCQLMLTVCSRASLLQMNVCKFCLHIKRIVLLSLYAKVCRGLFSAHIINYQRL